MYDNLIVVNENIAIKTNTNNISSDTKADITATYTDIKNNDVKNKTIYFYTVDEIPENKNGENYISMNGEIICEEYLPENSIVNPETSFGWLLYMIVGRGFDIMDEMTNTFLNDCDPTSTQNSRILDQFYGVNLNLPRPKITENNVERLLTDKEYAAYLYLRRSRLITRLDLLSVFGHCMGDNTYDDIYNGVTVTDEKNAQWHAVDHLHYNSPTDNPSSNISKNSNDDLNHIVKHGNQEDVYTIPGETAYTGEYITYVNIPAADWSKAFLDFLTDYISIKGNVLVREVVR